MTPPDFVFENGNGERPAWFDIEISIVRRANAKETFPFTAGQALQGIAQGYWKAQCDAVTTKFDKALSKAEEENSPDPVGAAKDAVTGVKQKLPGLCWSAVFRGYRQPDRFEAHCGILCADFDKLGQRLEEIWIKLTDDRHIQAAWRSPTGTGLKVLFRIRPDPGAHLLSFRAVARHVRQTYNLEIDPKCKDVARLCFVSYDPGVFVRREDAAVIEPLEPELPAEEEAQAQSRSIEAEEIPDNVIILPSGNVGQLKSAQRLFSILARKQDIFIRGGAVNKLTMDQRARLCLEIVDDHEFRTLIEEYGPVAAWRAGSHAGQMLLKFHAQCSIDRARMYLKSGAKNLLPPITTVHNCPILTESENGLIVLEKGYHRICGGRLIAAGEPPLEMSLDAAKALLLDMVSEYDPVSEADKSRMIAAAISPALKMGDFLRAHFPIFAVEADESQAGKGHMLELHQRIYGEIASFVTQREGGVGSFDESLSQAMIDGHPFIQLDNIVGRLKSPFFTACMTVPLGGNVQARVPHHGAIKVYPDAFIFVLSSNGIESTRDLANRALIIRIRKRHGFKFKEYDGKDLLSYVIANQPKYLGAIYAVVTHWVRSGKLHTDDQRGEGRFRRWAQVLDWIVQNVFNLPPLLDGHQDAQARISSPALTWLRQICLALEADNRLGVALMATDIFELCQHNNIAIAGLAAGASDDKALMRVGCLLGKIFEGGRAIAECDEFQVQKTETDHYDKARRQNVILKHYSVSRSTTPNCSSQNRAV